MGRADWIDVEALADKLDVSFEESNGHISLIKRQYVFGLFPNSDAGMAAALAWLSYLGRMMELAGSTEEREASNHD
jgi:hypothetical protein